MKVLFTSHNVELGITSKVVNVPNAHRLDSLLIQQILARAYFCKDLGELSNHEKADLSEILGGYLEPDLVWSGEDAKEGSFMIAVLDSVYQTDL